MTKYTSEEDNTFNAFISSCIQELKKERICYVYNEEQIDIIKKAIQKRYNKKIICIPNECGYTLKLKKEEL